MQPLLSPGPLFCLSLPNLQFTHSILQLLDRSPTTLQGSDPQSAPVGVNPRCGIPRAGHEDSISNIANIVACGVSILILLFLIYKSGRRKAAVGAFKPLLSIQSPLNPHIVLLGRVEFRIFLIVYLITLPLQIITNGSLLQQGSTALVVFTALHAGLIVALFWILVTNAIVATQWIDDGTMSSLMVREQSFIQVFIVLICLLLSL